MTEEQFKKLDVGDLVRHVEGSVVWIVTGNYGDRITAVRSVDLTQPNEWALVKRAAS